MTGNSKFAVSVHILAYLAFRQGMAVPSTEIAGSVRTNPVVIRRLLAALVKAELVTTQKGAGGGFTLARTPAKISVLDIYHAVEPKPQYGMQNFSPNHDCPVGSKIEEVLQSTFRKAHASMEAELALVTLAQIEKELHSVCPHAK